MLCGTIECLVCSRIGYERQHEHEHEISGTVDENESFASWHGMAWH